MADEVQTAQETPEAAKTEASQTLVTASPEGEKPAAGAEAQVTESKAEETVKPPVVPEKYDLKLPEKSMIDQSALDKIAAYAKAQGLSNEQAQSLLERENEAVASFADTQQKHFKAEVEKWVSEVKSDKELGGELYEKNIELAKRVVHRFGTEGFRNALNESGLGNHPELVRVFVRIAKSMGEDTLVKAGANRGTRSMEEIFYGDKKT